MKEQMRENVRSIVRGTYDLQKLRIQAGNRIVANFKSKMGQEPSKKEKDTISAEGQTILKTMRKSYDRITDGVVTFPKQATFKGDELISSYTELVLMAQYVEGLSNEEAHFRRLGHVLKEIPIYTAWLQGVRGVGPATAGVIISELDITKAEYPSSLWKYAGLDVASDGAGRSRRKEHLIKVTYKNKAGEEMERDSITFNPFLKTKLIGVLGASFIKAGGPYRDIYDAYKHRLENHEKHKEKTNGHRHNMAIRYMIKRFLADLYREWRAIEGLPVALEYSEAKLGKTHRKAA